MKHTDENIFDRPPKQRSFVGKLAVRTKSKISNFQPYKTISKLFVGPDTTTWRRFDQRESGVKIQDQETGFDTVLDMSGSDSIPEEGRIPYTQRKMSSALRDKMHFSGIISPLHQHFQKSKHAPPNSENIQTVTNFNSSGNEKLKTDGIHLVSHKPKRFSLRMPGSFRKGEYIPDQRKSQSRWKTFFDAFEVEDMRAGRGFWQNWRSGVSDYWHVFTGETTAHGYKRTMAPHRSMFGRLLWVLAIIGVTSCAIALLYNTMNGQGRYAFSSSIQSKPMVSMPFPAVTVCNLASYDYSRIEATPLRNDSQSVREFLLRASGLQDSGNESMAFPVFGNYTTKDLHHLIGWKLENFIRNCSWNERPLNCCEIFIQSKTLTETCFTFNFDLKNPRMADRVGSVSGLSLILDAGDGKKASKLRVASGLKVLLHEPTEFPNARENGVLISPGTTTYMSVTKTQYEFLARPYKAYSTEYCSDSEGVSGNTYYNYTGHSSCVAECRLKAILDKCRCVVYAKDPDIPGVPYCSSVDYISCYIPTLRETFVQSSSSINNCSCPLPCKKVEYNAQMSSASFPRTVEGVIFMERNYLSNNSDEEKDIMENFVELKIFYKDLFTHLETHVPMNTWLTIFGNVGGQLGLFIGASVLTALEFLELLIMMVWLLIKAAYVHLRTKWRSDSRNLSDPCKSETGLP